MNTAENGAIAARKSALFDQRTVVVQVERWIVNTKKALDLWREVVSPDEVVPNLAKYTELKCERKFLVLKTCKTYHCFGGWLAEWDFFKQQGLALWGQDNTPVLHTSEGPFFAFDAANKLFGKPVGYRSLFGIRHEHPDVGTDWQVVESRLVNHLATLKTKRSQILGLPLTKVTNADAKSS